MSTSSDGKSKPRSARPAHRVPRSDEPDEELFQDATPYGEDPTRYGGGRRGRLSDDTGHGRLRDDPRYRARLYLRGEQPHPWRVYEGQQPARSTVKRWKRIARELAQYKYDAPDACHACFRPVLPEHYRYMKLIGSGQGGRPWERVLCRECIPVVKALLSQMMVNPPWREDQEPEGWEGDDG